MADKIYAFDLDGTLCQERKTFEKCLAAPKQNVIDVANKLYDEGNTIIIFTARSWSEHKMTEYWLKENKVKYHQLICGKPIYNVFVDDRALNVKDIEELEGK